MNMFQPILDRARWRIVYDLLVATPTDGILTYDAMAAALELHPEADRHAIQMAVRRAAKEHEEVDSRAIDAIPNLGYRVVPPPEHLTLAKRQQRRSNRALKSGHSKVVHVDLDGVEPEVRHAFQVVAQAFSMQMEFNRRADVRQSRLEDAVGEIVQRSERSEAEIAALKERLARIEQVTSEA